MIMPPVDPKTLAPVVTALSLIRFSKKNWLVIADARSTRIDFESIFDFPLLLSDTGEIVESIRIPVSSFVWLSCYSIRTGRIRLSHRRIFAPPKRKKMVYRVPSFLGRIKRAPFVLQTKDLRTPSVGDILTINPVNGSRFGIDVYLQFFRGRIVHADGWFVGATSFDGSRSFVGVIPRRGLCIDGKYHPAASNSIFLNDLKQTSKLVDGPMRRIGSYLCRFGVSGFFKGSTADVDLHDEKEVCPFSVDWLRELMSIKKRMAIYWRDHDFFPVPPFGIACDNFLLT
jgi:hypothetical protein